MKIEWMGFRFWIQLLLAASLPLTMGCSNETEPIDSSSSASKNDQDAPDSGDGVYEPPDSSDPAEPVMEPVPEEAVRIEPEQPETPQPPLAREFMLSDFAESQGICSKLSLEGLIWSVDALSEAELYAFLLALNISGSFEGPNGWQNLTNDFDNQGLSFGLLNQTLGTGSLQPLWYAFRKRHPELWIADLGTQDQTSELDSMLNRWVLRRGGPPADIQAQSLKPLELSPAWQNTSLSPNQESANWARSILYTTRSGRYFKSTWRNTLIRLASHPNYIVIQMQAALTLHRRAMSYMSRLGFLSLTAYLTLFDIVVQNGSLRSTDIREFQSFKTQNPNLSEEAQLLHLVDLRLRHVIPRWVEDVRSRKYSIINDRGRVHGRNREYSKEFCFEDARAELTLRDLP